MFRRQVSVVFCRAPTKHGAVTGAQSNGAEGRTDRVPTAEQLPPLVARSPLAVFDEAIVFLRTRPALFLTIAAVGLLPARAISALLPGTELRELNTDQLFDLFIANFARPGSFITTAISFALDSFVLFVVAAVYGQIAAAWFVGTSPPPKALALNTLKRLPALFAAWLIAKLLMVALGVVSVGVGALAFGVVLAIVAPIMGAEGVGPIVAIRRSMSLITSKLGQGFLVFVTTGLGAVLIRLAIKQGPGLVLSNFFAGQIPLPEEAIVAIFDVVGSIIALAFIASASVVLYLDLRVRREGLDLGFAISQAFPGRAAGVRRG